MAAPTVTAGTCSHSDDWGVATAWNQVPASMTASPICARLNQARTSDTCPRSSRTSKEPSRAIRPATAGGNRIAEASMSGKLTVKSSPAVVGTGRRSTAAISRISSRTTGCSVSGARASSTAIQAVAVPATASWSGVPPFLVAASSTGNRFGLRAERATAAWARLHHADDEPEDAGVDGDVADADDLLDRRGHREHVAEWEQP